MKRERVVGDEEGVDNMWLDLLPLELWRLIIEYAGLKLLVEPVCRAWLVVARDHERQSLDEWMHEVADGGGYNPFSPIRTPANLVRELGITGKRVPTVQQWAAGLRGIPNLMDLDFCRALRKLQKLNEWLGEQRHHQLLRQQTPPEKRLLKNMYLLWSDGPVLRVLRREHYNHLLRRPRDVASGGVISSVGPVPLEDDEATEQYICMPSGPLHSIPLLLLPFDVQRWGDSVEWGSGEGVREEDAKKQHRIGSLDEYRQLEDLGRVSFVYVVSTGGKAENVWGPDTVMQYLRNMRHWHRMARQIDLQCCAKKKLARDLLPSLWYGHCNQFAEATMKGYEDIVAQGKMHWAFADAQMAKDLCEVTKCGLLVVDSKSTRVHAPVSYSDAELEWFAGEDEEDPYKAYVRVYVPYQFFGRLKRRLPRDIFYSESDGVPGCATNDNFMDAQGFNRRQQIPWPDMDARSNQIEWEQQTFGLDRMPALLDLVLVEFVDGQAERGDGYLFSTLLALCRQFLVDDTEARLHIASDRVLLDDDAARSRGSYQNVLLREPLGRQALRVVGDVMAGLIFEHI